MHMHIRNSNTPFFICAVKIWIVLRVCVSFFVCSISCTLYVENVHFYLNMSNGRTRIFSCRNQMIQYCVGKVVYCAFVTWDSSLFFYTTLFPLYVVYFWHSFLAYLHTYSNYGGEFLTAYTQVENNKKTPSCFCTFGAHTHAHNLKSLSIFLSFIEYYKSFPQPYVCLCVCVCTVYAHFAPSNTINYYPSTSSNKAQYTFNDVATFFLSNYNPSAQNRTLLLSTFKTMVHQSGRTNKQKIRMIVRENADNVIESLSNWKFATFFTRHQHKILCFCE